MGPPGSEKPFVVEPIGGTCVSYGTLLDSVSDPLEEGIESVLRPGDTVTFFAKVIAGILRKQPLTLLSGSAPVSSTEIGVTTSTACEGGDPVNRSEIRLSSIDALTSALRSCPEAKITLFTSGSTGRPKRVTHTLATLIRGVRVDAGHGDDVWGLAYRPAHVAGLLVFLQAVMNGNTMVDLNGLSPEAIPDVIEQQGITHLSATPTFFRLLPSIDVPLKSVRRVTFGGEALDPGLMARMSEVFPEAKFLNVYASTEAGTLFAARGSRFSLPEGLGEKARVVDGELQLHRSLLGELGESEWLGEDAWYATGDLIEQSADNEEHFEFRGRRGQEVNVGGYKVDPLEVETAVRSQAKVRDCRVFGRPNSVLGSILCCDVILELPMEEGELRAALMNQLSPQKMPRVWRFVDQLETTSSGKRRLT